MGTVTACDFIKSPGESLSKQEFARRAVYARGLERKPLQVPESVAAMSRIDRIIRAAGKV
jgi:hypothetical protein